jgi:hypothetical protein
MGKKREKMNRKDAKERGKEGNVCAYKVMKKKKTLSITRMNKV